MRAYLSAFILGASGLALAGCSTPLRSFDAPPSTTRPAHPAPTVLQAGYLVADLKEEELPAPKKSGKQPATGTLEGSSVGLPQLIGLTLERNPRLAQVGWAIETARGRAVQAGLYPNPTVNVTGNELGDRTGPSGIW